MDEFETYINKRIAAENDRNDQDGRLDSDSYCDGLNNEYLSALNELDE